MRANARAFYELATVSGYELRFDQPLPWLTPPGHTDSLVATKLPKKTAGALDRILAALDGDHDRLATKTRGHMDADFLLPTDQHIEFDEIQHFTRARGLTLKQYPVDTPLGFDLDYYREICERWSAEGGRGFAHKTAAEFPGVGGRMRQRAFFDAFRDLVAPVFATAL